MATLYKAPGHRMPCFIANHFYPISGCKPSSQGANLHSWKENSSSKPSYLGYMLLYRHPKTKPEDVSAWMSRVRFYRSVHHNISHTSLAGGFRYFLFVIPTWGKFRFWLPSLKLTAKAPKNGFRWKTTILSYFSNFGRFSGANLLLVSGRVMFFKWVGSTTNISNEKRAPWLVGVFRGWHFLPSYIRDCFINQMSWSLNHQPFAQWYLGLSSRRKLAFSRPFGDPKLQKKTPPSRDAGKGWNGMAAPPKAIYFPVEFIIGVVL